MSATSASGVPVDEDQWGWSCGFYPGCDPGQHTSGSGETFEAAPAEFEEAWERLKPTRTEAHYELWRPRDFHAWKDRMHDARLKLPTQRTGNLITMLLRRRDHGQVGRGSRPGGPPRRDDPGAAATTV